MYVSQVVMSSLPNIELVSLLIILVTRKFGIKAFYSVYIFVACEILTYGISEWVINYMYVWAVFCVIILLFRKIDSAVFYALISAIFGIMFGTLCSIPSFIIGGVSMGISYILAGFWFDILHCGGNFILVLLLFKPLSKALEKALKSSK